MLQVVELIEGVSKYVKDNEPGTLIYQINRDLRPAKDGNEDIVMLERYDLSSEAFAAYCQPLTVSASQIRGSTGVEDAWNQQAFHSIPEANEGGGPHSSPNAVEDGF